MVVSSHQSEKLSQLQTMLEAGRAGVLKVGSGKASQAAAYVTGMAYRQGLDQMMVKAVGIDM